MNKELTFKIISIAVILLLTYLSDLIISIIINKGIKKGNKNLKTYLIFINRAKKLIIYFVGIMLVLSKFSMFKSLSVTLLSGIGILTTVLGLAAKESLGNIFGSLSLLVSKPFEVGDTIKIVEKDVIGAVEEISMRHTIIKTFNNQRVIIPNSILNNLTIENYDYKTSEVCFYYEAPISYESDVDKAIKIMEKEMKAFAGPSDKNIAYPKVRVVKWDSSAIVLRGWIYAKDFSTCYENLWKLNYELKKKFDQNNIEIPYNHMNVILDNKSKKNV